MNLKKILTNKKTLIGLLVIILIFIISVTGRGEKATLDENFVAEDTYVKTVPEESYSWSGYTPGKTNYDEVKDKLGKRVTRTKEDGLWVYTHKEPESGIREYKVAVNDDNIIQYISIPITYSQAETLEEYNVRFNLKEPDIVLYEKGGFGQEAYVYLDEGIMLTIYAKPKFIYNETYFEPTTYDKFMEIWGDNLTTEAPIIEDGPFNKDY